MGCRRLSAATGSARQRAVLFVPGPDCRAIKFPGFEIERADDIETELSVVLPGNTGRAQGVGQEDERQTCSRFLKDPLSSIASMYQPKQFAFRATVFPNRHHSKD